MFTYLINHLKESNAKILGITGTKSEHKIFQVNKDSILRGEQQPSLKLRSNFIYHIQSLNGKSYIVCQMFNQLKSNELYDWIKQLWTRVEFDSTLIVCSQNKASYYGTDTRFPCVKYISSTKTPSFSQNDASYLEEPNFVGGIAAASKY